MEIQTFRIDTSMGRVFGFLDRKKIGSFLTEDEMKEFDNIGYTGKDSQGKRITFEEYLNSLGKGEFKVVLLKQNTGEYTSEYLIIRVV